MKRYVIERNIPGVGGLNGAQPWSQIITESVDLFAVYTTSLNEHLNLLCGVENLTNEVYRVHGSGQNEAGINGIFGLRLNW